MTLDRELSNALLKQSHTAYNTQPNDLLIAALVQTFCEWTGAGNLRLGLEGHGRESVVEDVDTSHTFGWLTSFFPVTLRLQNTTDPNTAIKSIKEQLRAIPNRGIGYGVIRYLWTDRDDAVDRLLALPEPQVLFNYMGSTRHLGQSTLFRRIERINTASRNLENERSHLLEINTAMHRQQLKMNWTYSTQRFRRSTIEGLAQSYMDALRSLIAHCLAPDSAGYTPSDFPEADLSQEELDRFIRTVS